MSDNIIDWISDGNYVLYRYPQQKVVNAIKADNVICLSSIDELNSIEHGFIFAPFRIGKQPIIVFTDGHKCVFTQPERNNILQKKEQKTANITSSYSTDFKLFKEAVSNGRFKKIVLARTLNTEMHSSPIDLFMDTCVACPNSFVYLFASAENGMWLGATPEILIEGNNLQMHTVALAGTMCYDGIRLPDISEWDTKNLNEQKIVTDYLIEQIHEFGKNINIVGPYTAQAARLAHIKTDIYFNINGQKLSQLIAAIHPTPAVCGLPKTEAMEFINTNESAEREYYAGFLGWYDANGDTRLFVNLRCMKWIDNNTVKLIAGGGILPESNLESEWAETENKMRTLTDLKSFI